MSQPEALPGRPFISFKTVLLVLLIAVIVLFCVLNSQPVRVWPFREAPMYLVILLSFALGLASGWLWRSVMRTRSRQTSTTDGE